MNSDIYRKYKEELSLIKLLVLDVDGVLTDGSLYYGIDGEVFKRFNVKDGLGIKLLLEHIEVAFISSNLSKIITSRAIGLGIKHCFLGINNKKKCLDLLASKLNLRKEQIAFVGDDLNDAILIDEVGLFLTPNDAHVFVKESADIMIPIGGGQGAVRLLADWILESKGLGQTSWMKGNI